MSVQHFDLVSKYLCFDYLPSLKKSQSRNMSVEVTIGNIAIKPIVPKYESLVETSRRSSIQLSDLKKELIEEVVEQTNDDCLIRRDNEKYEFTFDLKEKDKCHIRMEEDIKGSTLICRITVN